MWIVLREMLVNVFKCLVMKKAANSPKFEDLKPENVYIFAYNIIDH